MSVSDWKHCLLSLLIILTAFVIDNALCIRFPDRVHQPDRDPPDQRLLQTAVFALGSFWRSEAVFGCLPGVIRTTAGYAGGSKPNPEYRSLGDHAESIQVLNFLNLFPCESNFVFYFLLFISLVL